MEKESFTGYDVFNMGTGKGSSVLEVINAFEKATGVKLKYEIGPRRAGDVEQVWGDVTKSTNQIKLDGRIGHRCNDVVCMGMGKIYCLKIRYKLNIIIMKKIIITGGAGFIGSHVVRRFVKNYPEYQIINLDKLTYAGNLANLKDIENEPNYKFVKGDIVDVEFINQLI